MERLLVLVGLIDMAKDQQMKMHTSTCKRVLLGLNVTGLWMRGLKRREGKMKLKDKQPQNENAQHPRQESLCAIVIQSTQSCTVCL